jgi:hypothetical protein
MNFPLLTLDLMRLINGPIFKTTDQLKFLLGGVSLIMLYLFQEK